MNVGIRTALTTPCFVFFQIVKHTNGDAWVEAQGKPYSPQQIGAVSTCHALDSFVDIKQRLTQIYRDFSSSSKR